MVTAWRKEFWHDRSFLLQAARRNPEALLQVDEALRRDFNFMLAAVSERGSALASCAPRVEVKRPLEAIFEGLKWP